MDITIDDQISNLYLSPYNISRQQVIDTINNADVNRTVHQGDYTIALFLRKFDSHYILVDGRPKPSSILVSNVFKFNEQLIRDLPADNPLGMLEKFANEVGYEIKIGDERSKFIHATEIRLPAGSSMHDIGELIQKSIIFDEKHNDPNRPLTLGDMLMRPKDLGGVIYVDVALAYCISTVKYSRYLKANNLI